SRLAGVLLGEVKQRSKVVTALRGSALAAALSGDDAAAFDQAWATKGLPGSFTGTLSKLGATKAEQREVSTLLLSSDPYASVGKRLNFADSSLLQSLRQIAAELKTFAKKAAKDPLGTGT